MADQYWPAGTHDPALALEDSECKPCPSPRCPQMVPISYTQDMTCTMCTIYGPPKERNSNNQRRMRL